MNPATKRPPRGVRRGILDAFRKQLRDDAELKRCVQTWQLGVGDPADLIAENAISTDQLPLFRLEFEGSPGFWRNQVTHKFELTAAISIYLPGLDQSLACDWWEAVEQALFPGDGSFLGHLKTSYQVSGYEISSAAVSRRSYLDTVGQLVTGRIRIHHEIRTKV